MLIKFNLFKPFFIPFIPLFAAVFLVASMSGCSLNPATGERSFTGLLSTEDEKRIGAEEHPKLVQAFGGLYDDEKIQAYVRSIGKLVHATTEMNDTPFQFFVLDSPVVNAFALPGGYIYVTRGLLALANDEAELAGVLAHEIGHVTARHSAQRYSRDLVVNLGTTIIGAVVGSQPIAELGNIVGSAYIQGYSREQEHQADMLGVRYLARAGYDPTAMSTFLNSMSAESSLKHKIDGKIGEGNEYNLFSSHPRTAERIVRSANEAIKNNRDARTRDRNLFLNKIDGLVWGDSLKQGSVKGRSFEHPYLRFNFVAPKDFKLKNTPSAVLGDHFSGATLRFDGDYIQNEKLNTQDYMRIEWLPEVKLIKQESLKINGFDAATATGLISIRGDWANARFVVIRWKKNYVYRFLFVNPVTKPPVMDNNFRDSAFSFRKLSNSEAQSISYLRIKVLKVKHGQNKKELASRMEIEGNKLEWFNVLNGFNKKTGIKADQLVKIIGR
ncbi:MAG: hypothetical protein CMM30_09810 [Rhodospirillaceae bacterium]|nr:hypothetical protein [Rhodospirillaceae bacterium]|tara:strand:- start:1536 stop:3029 length:1494 start_codon:yes stop_codon:yes gene_type:complete